MAQRTAAGPLGQPRSIGICILLAIVTLSFYCWYWAYMTHREIKDYSGAGIGGGIGLVLYIFTGGFATFFLAPYEIQTQLYEGEGEPAQVTTAAGFWFLLPLAGVFIWFFKVQQALNDFWILRGAMPAR
jgi:hypothetical protein